MSLGFDSGERRRAPCATCALEVEQHRLDVAGALITEYWSTQPHTAPCGLPCMGGGAHGKDGIRALRAGAMHGIKDVPCPACARR